MIAGEWHSTDPRVALDGTLSHIAVSFTHGMRGIVGALVEAKHGYYISLYTPVNHVTFIGPGDAWPDGWSWALLPKFEWEK